MFLSRYSIVWLFTYGNGLATKKKMLQGEGVLFKKDSVDLAASAWNPK